MAFCLVGSWDEWSHFTVLQKSAGSCFVARVPVRRPPAIEEFQILQGNDWSKRYYPAASSANKSSVEGPANVHGRNFRITALPAECMQLEIHWDLSSRQVSWKLLDVSGSELQLKGAPSQRKSFFLVGSWDNWKGFTELWPCTESTFRGMVKVDASDVQFQILRERDWGQRFHPDAGGDGLEGPDGQHGRNWRAKLSQRWLEVTWSPSAPPHVQWRSVSAAAQHSAAAERFARLMAELRSEGCTKWLQGMARIFEALPKLQRSSPYGKKAEQDATAQCLLATALRDLETLADPKGPASVAQREALQQLEAKAEALLQESGFKLPRSDFMQEALPVDTSVGVVHLKAWHRLVYLPLVMYVRNTVHLYELLERLKAQASAGGELRQLLDGEGTARRSPYSWLVFSILGAMQTVYQVRDECRGLLEFLASSPPQTLWVKDGVEWTPSAGHSGFHRKSVPNVEPMKPPGSLRSGDSLMFRGIWVPPNTEEDQIRYQYSFQSFSRSIEGVMRVLRFYSGVTSTKAADAARVGHMLIYVGRHYATSPWVVPVQLFDGPKKKAGDSEQELLLPPFLAYDFEEDFSIDPHMELPEKQSRMNELEDLWSVQLPENLKHFVLGLLPHLNHSQVSTPSGGYQVSLRFLRSFEPVQPVAEMLKDPQQFLYLWSAEGESDTRAGYRKSERFS